MLISQFEFAILALLAQVGSAQDSASTIKASSNVGAPTSDAYSPASSKQPSRISFFCQFALIIACHLFAV